MKICGLLSKNHIFLSLKANDKKKILEEFVGALKSRELIRDDKLILHELMKRESLGSTGLENGIAVPHALTEETKETFLAMAVVKNGIDFEAVDQMPTYILLLLLGNKNNPGNQLKVLAHICRLVKETDFVAEVKKAGTPESICEILEKEEAKII